MKGADEEILKRVVETETRSKTVKIINKYSNKGLRTLVLAKKIIPSEVYQKWLVKLRKAKS